MDTNRIIIFDTRIRFYRKVTSFDFIVLFVFIAFNVHRVGLTC